ncbi:CbiX/SirB N-terminal domain-containing protein [Paracoccus aerodenitrificans]|uniref:CbiX/SirB N-terminal domain-containing protein n=1 Tax=Paracoccus aerodenitrificans TaxID=3017781 RepID=UPI0022F01C33|nr:CbiX/SirB N-terminal domain-containing protein [Paracoccus aerodenitrificans]WBU63686.1 cobalamin biosynthesis protein CbiX [Paracoccus aerodenitrificans]
MTRPAILVSHGQPSDPDPQQKAVEALAADVAAISGRRVIGATLAKTGALEDAVGAAPDALVYPMFMAEGWFTGTELPRRLEGAGGAGLTRLRPFGVDPGLSDLCLRLIRDEAEARGLSLQQVTLLLIAHGSKRARGSAKGAEEMAEKLRTGTGRVVTGFIEETPFLADAATGLGPDAIALPFFATRAEHVTDDIPEALAQAGFEGPCLPPVGLAPQVPALIAAALGRGDAAIASERLRA